MSQVVTIDPGNPDEVILQRAAQVVRSGGLIVYPTETLYGIGADATNPGAIKRVSEAKKRTEQKPVLVLVDSVEMMSPLVEAVPLAARILMQGFWPGPLTIVFSASDRVPTEITRGSKNIGIRIPSSRLCLRLLAHLRTPLTSTSANLSGEPPVRAVQEIHKDLTGIDLYLDAGELPESLPSTVVDVSGLAPRLLRHGAIPVEQIQQVLPGTLV